MNNTAGKRGIILGIIGLILSTVPTVICVLSYFPLWQERGSECVLSGIALLLILLSLVPLIRIIKGKLRTPSAYMIWLMIFMLFASLSRIADQMTVISFVGFLSNLIGSVFFKLSKRYRGGAYEED